MYAFARVSGETPRSFGVRPEKNPAGDFLEGDATGFFTTGNGTGSGGNGTNAITTFSVGKLHSYSQTSTALPTLDPDPYSFLAVTGLASNRTATSVTLTLPTLPTATVSDLDQIRPESFILVGFTNDLTTFDKTFPAGNYSFFVQAVSSNQTVVVNLPPGMAQPNAPHLTNYPAAQAVDPNSGLCPWLESVLWRNSVRLYHGGYWHGL